MMHHHLQMQNIKEYNLSTAFDLSTMTLETTAIQLLNHIIQKVWHLVIMVRDYF